jgi:hypothetical protein
MNIEDKALDIILDHTASSEWEDVCELTWNTDEVQELLIKALNQGQILPIDSVVESALTPEDLTIFAKWVDEHFYTHRLKILPRELEKFYIENRESIVKQYS